MMAAARSATDVLRLISEGAKDRKERGMSVKQDAGGAPLMPARSGAWHREHPCDRKPPRFRDLHPARRRDALDEKLSVEIARLIALTSQPA